tara:strand:- start:221 stop:466 length:246 start_codon:yes stop_codon:yes gene_type:complete
MAFKMKYKNLEEVVKQLKGAVKAHAKQAEIVEDHIDEMKEGSPNKLTLTSSCKAAARRKFKVYPSAYANAWASQRQKEGNC